MTTLGYQYTPEQRERMGAWQRGIRRKPLSAEHRAKISAAGKGRRTGEGNSSWSGDEVSYSGLHQWIRKQKGRASDQKCEHCGQQALDWANVSGEYLRDLDDFIALCRRCHKLFDQKEAA
jgi:hypothetical protein